MKKTSKKIWWFKKEALVLQPLSEQRKSVVARVTAK